MKHNITVLKQLVKDYLSAKKFKELERRYRCSKNNSKSIADIKSPKSFPQVSNEATSMKKNKDCQVISDEALENSTLLNIKQEPTEKNNYKTKPKNDSFNKQQNITSAEQLGKSLTIRHDQKMKLETEIKNQMYYKKKIESYTDQIDQMKKMFQTAQTVI